MPYPDLLAGGVTLEGTQYPFELFAGESDTVTDQGTAGGTIRQFEIISMDEAGLLIVWNPNTGTASLAGTFSGVGVNNETITVNGTVFTFKTTPTGALDVALGTTAATAATNFAAKVNAQAEATRCRASVSGAVVTIYSLEPGEGGNGVAVSEASANFAWAGSATALAGGFDAREARPVGIAAQPIATGEDGPYFSGGFFAHDALLWPATVNTLAKRKLAFSRTNIQIGKLLGSSATLTFPA